MHGLVFVQLPGFGAELGFEWPPNGVTPSPCSPPMSAVIENAILVGMKFPQNPFPLFASGLR